MVGLLSLWPQARLERQRLAEILLSVAELMPEGQNVPPLLVLQARRNSNHI
eukprot:m.399841 g.399841  ORF g.399841 m.399841 type:complete len:51 (-) comp56437_c0_seq15:939-1091(-)